jgi:tRNA (guanine-N7-)-methyltransferase
MPDSALPLSAVKHRPVRSFVRREGRATQAQKQALVELWPLYGFQPELEAETVINFDGLFGRAAPLALEIGYGDGEALVDAAMQRLDTSFIGAEVYPPGVGHCLLRIEAQELTNIRLVQLDAIDLLKSHIPDAALKEIRLFFPDPWPKKKHHKRRIVNACFCQLISRKLLPGGQIHFATDWAPYAEWAMEVFEACPTLENVAGAGRFTPRPKNRTLTKFERRGLRLGQAPQDLIYRTLA